MKRLIEMEAFASVVDQGGFTSAAKKMGISKSAVSKHVANLETRLGARLLNRSTRRVGPTEIGLAFYDRARRVLNDAGDAEALVRSMQGKPSGRLRISVATDFGVNTLSPVVSRFLDDQPDVKVELVLSNRRVDLISEGFDLAIRIGDMADSTLVARKLAESNVRIVASPRYLEQHGQPKKIEDLSEHKLLNYLSRSNGETWKLARSSGKCEQVHSNSSLSVNDGQSLLNAVRSGAGMACLPSFLYCDAMEAGEVVDAMPGLELKSQSIHIVYPPGRFVQPKVRAFIDFLVAAFARKGPEHW
ncbi:LysR family transcriptional regulator [Primorskyibacter sp. S87]|uniref:LysR family transcriptional regulator n=1 Tax=Primorskyibacter sp. S87 TaxID=3415126 RepID=UPI003C7A56D8